MRKFLIICSLLMAGGYALPNAQEPTAVDALKARQNIIAEAQSALDGAPGDPARKEALNEAIRETFDFDRLAHESIGDNWSVLNDAQKTEYMKLFNKLVEKSTVAKLKNYRAANTDYVDVQQDSSEATITTVVESTEGDEVAIQYRLHLRDGRWWVWDTTVGLDTEITEYDVSTAQNYSSAFNKIISDNGVEELLNRLRNKAGDDESM